jgi:glycosyltransferase involved in cell wall biosynthesis
VPPEKIKTIANGIDVTAFERAQPLPLLKDEGSIVVGVVARLDLQKGFEYLLRAARELCKMFPDLKIVIAGEGPDRNRIEEMIQQYGLQSSVVLAGQQSNMPAVYAAMDIFVLPSLNEGLPMTVLEAMAASKPVIATRVGAIPSVIRDGENGLLVAPKDSEGLRNAVASLLNDPERRRQLGDQAHAWVSQNYTSEAMALKYREMYEGVLWKPAPSAISAQQVDHSNINARGA